MTITPWQPYKLTFCPIDYYEYDSVRLNNKGFRFQTCCTLVDTVLLNIISGTNWSDMLNNH